MPKKREVLERLKRDELVDAVELFGLEVEGTGGCEISWWTRSG